MQAQSSKLYINSKITHYPLGLKCSFNNSPQLYNRLSIAELCYALRGINEKLTFALSNLSLIAMVKFAVAFIQ